MLFCGGCVSPAAAPSPHDPVPIDEYILVGMAHKYSFPEKPYTPEYFHADYVERVETISAYHEGGLNDKATFIRIEKLILTKKGRKNIEKLIAELNARDDICAAERDYEYYMGDDLADAVDAVPAAAP